LFQLSLQAGGAKNIFRMMTASHFFLSSCFGAESPDSCDINFLISCGWENLAK